jgi:molecular chaperone HtpG
MLSDEKFMERAKKFYLIKDTEGKYYTLDEYKEALGDTQKDKDDTHIWLYASDIVAQHAGIEEAIAKSYKVIHLNSPLAAHLTDRLERDLEKVRFARVDSDSIDRLIKKEDDMPSKLTEDEEKRLKEWVEAAVQSENYKVEIAHLSSNTSPIQIHVPEFMRRMKEMSATGGGYFGMTDMPETYQVVVNANHPLSGALLNTTDEAVRNENLKEALDLALLGQNLLHGAELSNFIKRTQRQLEEKLGIEA